MTTTDADSEFQIVNVVDQNYEMVDAATLELHPDNPNQGDVGAIAESMAFHGFYGVLYVQRSTRRVLAGNHRLMAARQLGLDEVPVVWLDVNDEQAARILLVDNRTTRLGSDDDKLLTELLQSLAMTDDKLAGTGFDGDDLDALLRDAEPTQAATPEQIVVSVVVKTMDEADELVKQLSAGGFEAKVEKK